MALVRVETVQRPGLDEYAGPDSFELTTTGRALECAPLGTGESRCPDESDVFCSGHDLSVVERTRWRRSDS
jgi:hypothetical protein